VAAAALQAAPEDKARKDAAAKAVEEADKAMRAFSDARANAELAVRLTGTATGAQGAAEGAAAAAEAALAEAVASVEALKKGMVALTAPKSMILLDGGRTALVSFDGGVLQWHAAASGAFLDATDGAVTAGAPVLLAAQGDGVLAARADKKVVRLPGRRGFVLERTIGKPDDAGVLASRVTALAFSSDARVLATGGGVPSRSGEVKLWNTTDGAALLTIPEPHSDTVNALAFSPDDGLIATAGSDRWARVFRTDDGKRTAAFEGHSGAVLSIGWRSDGLAMATGGSDKTLRFWDLLEGKQTKAITSFGKEVSAVAWLGTGDTVASASGDEGVRLNEEKLPGAKGFCFTVASDAGGKFVAAGGEDGVLRIWDAAAKKLVSEAK
jgi:WD40 repeat protein